MIRTKLFTACALAFAVSLAGTSASAQEPTNQITYFTFSAPFELPGGKVLPAGKYVFRIADSQSNRHIVRVMSEDQSQMHATLFAIPAQRQEAAEEPEIRFMEAEASAAPAIRTWWYPGRVIGHEFIYPKDHARRLAARQTEGVLTVAGDSSSDDAMREGELARLGADGRESAWNAENNGDNQAQQAAQNNQNRTTAGEAAQTAQSGQMTGSTAPERESAQPAARTAEGGSTSAQPAAADQRTTTRPATGEAAGATAERANNDMRATNQDRTELPRTAGALPLVALLGLGSLIGAGALRLRRK